MDLRLQFAGGRGGRAAPVPLVSDLYDLTMTVIVLPGNIGFGAANNLAVSQAASDAIYLINPDVYPVPGHAAALRAKPRAVSRSATLWGGLLFYDA